MLKENTAKMYPIDVKQYINGTWVYKTAKSRQNGQWVDWWNGELYIFGEEHTSVTGGWEANTNYNVNGAANNPSLVIKKSDHILLNAPSGAAIVSTVNKIDVTNYTTLLMDVNVLYGGQSDSFGVIASYSGDIYNNIPAAKVRTSEAGRQTLRIDVSTINGSYYVFAGCGARTREVHKVWLE